VTGDRKKRVPSRFLYGILGTELSLFSAAVRLPNTRI
jgi:hypothetical protein